MLQGSPRQVAEEEEVKDNRKDEKNINLTPQGKILFRILRGQPDFFFLPVLISYIPIIIIIITTRILFSYWRRKWHGLVS